MLIETLVTPGASSGSAGAWLCVVNAVSAAQHGAVAHFVCKPETRLNGAIKSVIVISVIRACEYLAAVQLGKPWHLERGHQVRIQPVHPVEPFCARQGKLIANTNVERQLGINTNVVLNE